MAFLGLSKNEFYEITHSLDSGISVNFAAYQKARNLQRGTERQQTKPPQKETAERERLWIYRRNRRNAAGSRDQMHSSVTRGPCTYIYCIPCVPTAQLHYSQRISFL